MSTGGFHGVQALRMHPTSCFSGRVLPAALTQTGRSVVDAALTASREAWITEARGARKRRWTAQIVGK
jgi:hypothetical protein